MRLTKLLLALDMVASQNDNDALPPALSAEATRLNWNRASRRIVEDAQKQVALERADLLQFAG
jgi:hypothetical protein